MKQGIFTRASGILLHISSLPGPHGIGDMRHAFGFIDFLVQSGQSYWQILPMTPTSPHFGNSPYMTFSVFAGNPLFISPDMLREEGLLDGDDLVHEDFSPYFVEYDKMIPWKADLLAKAWQRFKAQGDMADFREFCGREKWLADHSLFMALKEKYQYAPWYEWPEDLRCANRRSMALAAAELAERIDYFSFEQYLFFRQWWSVRAYAHEQNIKIIGDLSIYVGTDSVDVWANQLIFDLHKRTRLPQHVAGVPPDYFSKTGQLWGNPLYRWNSRKGNVREQLYDWWQDRFSTIYSLVDVIRIDHFRGFESYWSVTADEKTAENGKWKKGPGLMFFREMEKRLGILPVIAEDLGDITPQVEELRAELGYPGMKVLQFAFDSGPENPYLPFNYESDFVVYTGTHDNDTVVGWFLDPEVPESTKRNMKIAANKEDMELTDVHHDFIYLAHSSIAVLSVVPMQDLLGFGNDCRMNKPASSGDNWVWRCALDNFSTELAGWLHERTSFFRRLPRKEQGEQTSGQKENGQ